MNGKNVHFEGHQNKKGGKAQEELGGRNQECILGVMNIQSESLKLLFPKTFLLYENFTKNECKNRTSFLKFFNMIRKKNGKKHIGDWLGIMA